MVPGNKILLLGQHIGNKYKIKYTKKATKYEKYISESVAVQAFERI